MSSSSALAAVMVAGVAAACSAPATTLVDAACLFDDAGICQPACPPAAPYGYEVGDSVADLAFVTCDDTPFTLHDVCGARVAMIVNVYTWCPGCLDNAELARDLHAVHGREGLHPLVVIGEDAYQEPATAELCRQVRDYYELPATVVYDPVGALAIYGTTDLVMLTDVAGRIYFKRRGASAEVITMAVEAGLAGN